MEQESMKQWPFSWAVYNYLISTIIFRGKIAEIKFWACDTEKIVNCRINFENLPKIFEFAGIILAKNQRGYIFIIKHYLTLDYSLVLSAKLIFTFHSWNKLLRSDTLSSSVNNSEKNFPDLLTAEFISVIRCDTV